MKANDLFTENTNLHLTHLEDLALFQGKQGAERALSFLKSSADSAEFRLISALESKVSKGSLRSFPRLIVIIRLVRMYHIDLDAVLLHSHQSR